MSFVLQLLLVLLLVLLTDSVTSLFPLELEAYILFHSCWSVSVINFSALESRIFSCLVSSIRLRLAKKSDSFLQNTELVSLRVLRLLLMVSLMGPSFCLIVLVPSGLRKWFLLIPIIRLSLVRMRWRTGSKLRKVPCHSGSRSCWSMIFCLVWYRSIAMAKYCLQCATRVMYAEVACSDDLASGSDAMDWTRCGWIRPRRSSYWECWVASLWKALISFVEKESFGRALILFSIMSIWVLRTVCIWTWVQWHSMCCWFSISAPHRVHCASCGSSVRLSLLPPVKCQSNTIRVTIALVEPLGTLLSTAAASVCDESVQYLGSWFSLFNLSCTSCRYWSRVE